MSPAGPWAADVYFVRAGRDLCYHSSPRSRHASELDADPRVAATVHGEYDSPEEIRGVQLEGEVSEITEKAEVARVLDAYRAKFPSAAPLLDGGLSDRVRLYRISPTRLLWLDNSRGFGFREEVGW